MSLDVDPAGPGDASPEPPTEDEGPSLVSATLQAALETARGQLLDRTLRNKLISTNVASERARQVRVFDVLSDQVFDTLRTGVQMTFAPNAAARGAGGETGDETGEAARTSPEADGRDQNGVPGRPDRVLQTRLTPDGLRKRLTSLYYEGQTIEEEQGVSVLFLALGFLEWREAHHSDIPRFAPLMLLPVQLTRPSAGAAFRLTVRPDDLFTNFSLQAWLREQFDIRLPDLPDIDELTPSAYFQEVGRAVGSRPGWKVHDNEIVLGFFSFSKFLLWRDLDPENWPNTDALLDCAVLKRILVHDGGVEVRDEPVIGNDEVIEDHFSSAELVHVTDADSSQARAILEAMAGKNLVIQGPPGTGKSQTITNIIAGAVKNGKRVLFVAEKMAALEVVHDRLVKAKLGPLCLELHSRKSSKQQVLAQIKEGREAPAPAGWSERAFEELDQTQALLRRHSRRLHTATSAALTPFEILGGISRWRALGTPAPTFQLAAAAAWSADRVNAAEARMQDLATKLAEAGPPHAHPWRGLGRQTPNDLEKERLRPAVNATAESAENSPRQSRDRGKHSWAGRGRAHDRLAHVDRGSGAFSRAPAWNRRPARRSAYSLPRHRANRSCRRRRAFDLHPNAPEGPRAARGMDFRLGGCPQDYRRTGPVDLSHAVTQVPRVGGRTSRRLAGRAPQRIQGAPGGDGRASRRSAAGGDTPVREHVAWLGLGLGLARGGDRLGAGSERRGLARQGSNLRAGHSPADAGAPDRRARRISREQRAKGRFRDRKQSVREPHGRASTRPRRGVRWPSGCP